MIRTLLVGLVTIAACTDSPPPPIEPPPLAGPRATAVAYGDGRFVVLRHHPARDAFGELAIETSPDGEQWTEVLRIGDLGAQQGSVAFADGTFVAVASELVLFPDGTFAQRAASVTSRDGETWLRAADPPLDTSSVAGGGGTFVAVSGDNGIVATADGTAWSAPVPGTAQLWYSPQAVRVADRFVIFGEGPGVLESPDGVAWSAADTGLTLVHTIGALGAELVGFGYYDCCFGEVPDSIMHVELQRVAAAWNATVVADEGWQAFRDLGTRVVAVAVDGAQVVTSDDGGHTFDARSNAALYRATIAGDGAGTLVIAGGDLLVSHDDGDTWHR